MSGIAANEKSIQHVVDNVLVHTRRDKAMVRENFSPVPAEGEGVVLPPGSTSGGVVVTVTLAKTTVLKHI